MPTPNNSSRPAFTHPQVAVQNFVDTILDTPDMKYRPQYIILFGILLNNTELIAYAASVDPAVVNTPIPGHVQMVVEQLINPDNEPPVPESANAPNPG
jgi:hypothetical protein